MVKTRLTKKLLEELRKLPLFMRNKIMNARSNRIIRDKIKRL